MYYLFFYDFCDCNSTFVTLTILIPFFFFVSFQQSSEIKQFKQSYIMNNDKYTIQTKYSSTVANYVLILGVSSALIL